MPSSFSDKVEKLISILRVLVPWWLPEQLREFNIKTLLFPKKTESLHKRIKLETFYDIHAFFLHPFQSALRR